MLTSFDGSFVPAPIDDKSSRQYTLPCNYYVNGTLSWEFFDLSCIFVRWTGAIRRRVLVLDCLGGAFWRLRWTCVAWVYFSSLLDVGLVLAWELLPLEPLVWWCF